MKLIILNAGDAFELDGFNKLLIHHPVEDKTILQIYQELFDVDRIEIVVGFKAIQIMNSFPGYHYIHNRKWQTTASGYSLSLALSGEACYVVPSDYILNKRTIELMDQHENCALVKHTENRRISSLNARLDDSGAITSVYRGMSEGMDPELLGIFKISDPELLRSWKKNCVSQSQKYAGENLPLGSAAHISAVQTGDDIYEINTPEDYIQFLSKVCPDTM